MPPEAGQSQTDREAVHSFLDDRPDAEATLEAILDVDAERETWTFEDIPADSGTFGELVSQGIVEKADGEYRLADRDAVVAAVSGDAETVEQGDSFWESFEFNLDVSVDPRAMAGLAGALVFLLVMRITAYGSVMRDEHVISPGNDPYFFRYWMEELLTRSSGPTDWGVIATLPEGMEGTRPLSHATNWFVAELLGGGQQAATTVAAWLPVVATLALGVVLYKLATVLTDDPRVGIASVAVLATIPAHAVYTGIGFIDHQIHQYFWLGVTVLSLAWLAVDLQERRDVNASNDAAIRAHLSAGWTWVTAVALGIGVGFSAHAWGGSPLVFIPLAGYIGLRALMDARADVSPAVANIPLVVGVGLGSVISYLLHARWGWQESFAAYTPLLVFGGTIAVLVLGEVWRRFDWPLSALVVLEAGVAGAGLWLFRRLRPEDVAQLQTRVDDLFFRDGMTEANSLFAAEYGFVFGPLTQTGLAFYLALVPLGWATWVAYRRYEPGWLLMAVCTWYFTALAGIQMRFTGQLALFVSVLGGLGLVYVLSAVDLARTPLPFQEEGPDTGSLLGSGTADGRRSISVGVPDDQAQLSYLVGIFVLFAGLGMVLVPSLVSQVTYSDAEYQAAVAMDEHAESTNRTYPENYVLSEWDENRMFNYVVNGEAETYGYAERNYDDFWASKSLDQWYEQSERKIGYIVVTGEVESSAIGGQSTNGGESTDTNHQQIFISENREVAVYAVRQQE
ncbi:dolichyl-diphosphooligosaccharide--protein glycosyltransferase [Natronoarchaeum philippinense]|uniref:dolichyl-phosphooligosaccharide-protein glycotransferase n=1 Tax=Natronoarchaeum philippinense TaxID=558529 RepID=A0A285P2B5_NATPI|nr:MFS transporter [Natronoarchaeum philippinense]SNZ15417.1 dolichyl-diphosphooligosaccharide--protein glycosyltransferase [Natronoarchaeum philippinense]